MRASLVTTTLHDTAALRALEAEWWALWRRTPSATPFQSPAWLLPWWQAFAPGELFAVTVRRNGDLVGLAPLYIEDGAHGRRLLSLGISVSDYLDVLLDGETAEATGAALCRHVSPGTILFAHAIEDAVREGAHEMDLLRGGEPYKFGWGAEPRFNQRRVFRRGFSHVGAA